MIVVCTKHNGCENYQRGKIPCWDDSTKGQTVFCDDFKKKEEERNIRNDELMKLEEDD